MLPQIATPEYDMIVPSTGKPITYRPYLVKEEKILLIALESEDDTQIENAVVRLIEDCVKDDIDVNMLTMFDVEYIFISLRSKSVGEGIKLRTKCESCDQPNEVKVNLDDVEIIGKDNTEVQTVKLSDDLSVVMHWPYVINKLTTKEKTNQVESIIAVVAKCIETIYYGEDTYAAKDSTSREVKEFVENLASDQFEKLGDVIASMPYVSYDMNYKCEHCEQENHVELKGLSDFFT